MLVIEPTTDTFFCVPNPTVAPQQTKQKKRTVTGTVFDANTKETLVGANVKIKGTDVVEPTTDTFFCVPNPTTTTSFSNSLSDGNSIFMTPMSSGNEVVLKVKSAPVAPQQTKQKKRTVTGTVFV